MSMRYPKKKRYLLVAFFPCAAFTLFLAVDSSLGDSSTPWITEGSPGVATYAVLIVGGGLTGQVLGALVSRCLIRWWPGLARPPKPKKKSAWRYREMSRREKKRFTASLTLSLSATCAPLALYAFYNQPEGKAALVLWILAGAGVLGTLTGFVGMLIQIRPSRTVMQIVEDRLQNEREQWARELAALREADARAMDHWKNEAGMTLYNEIMRQVEEGLIACSKCTELGSAIHAALEEDKRVAAARDAEETGKACSCGGPTSVPLIYFPPRFQSKRTAS